MNRFENLKPITFAQLEQVASRSTIRAALRPGRLQSPMRGVYCGGGLTPSAADRVQIAQLAVGRDLPAGLHTAAQLHAFGVLDDGRTHLIGTEAQDHQPRNNLVVHSSVVSPSVVEVDGVRTATAARCAVDLARTHGAMDGLAVLDAALSRGLTRDELRAELV